MIINVIFINDYINYKYSIEVTDSLLESIIARLYDI